MHAVVVTYEPDLSVLRRLLASLEGQVAEVLIIDNSERTPLERSALLPFDVSCTSMGANVGIAAAQNAGADLAFTRGATDVIFFDQDSSPGVDMIERLLSARDEVERLGVEVAAIGPLAHDGRTAEGDFTVTRDFFRKRARPWRGTSVAPAWFVLASGALIDREAWTKVGPNDEALFIDCVDIEWGFRARAKGLTSFVALEARMQHQLGDSRLRFLGLSILHHSPLRHYYYYRNATHLLTQRYVPFAWKLRVLLASPLKLLAFSTIPSDREAHFVAICRGVAHGLRARLGRYDPQNHID